MDGQTEVSPDAAIAGHCVAGGPAARLDNAAVGGIRVLLDGYFIDRPYGFGRYVRELAHALSRLEAIDLVIAVPPDGESIARQLAPRASIVCSRNRFFPVWEQLVLPRLARQYRCHLIHFPYGSMSWAWPACKSVVTLHDLMFLGGGGTSQNRIDRLAHIYRRWIFNTKTQFAGRIISVSEATRNFLLKLAGVDSLVVPNTCEAFAKTYSHDVGPAATTPYFLHRGSLAPHKNTVRVVSAFKSINARFPKLELLVFGMTEEQAATLSLVGRGTQFLGKISDDKLAHLYRDAKAVVVPSIEEGFGLSIIEAFAFGTPVITSNYPPMSDIAGDAAILVDPLSEVEIGEAMASALESQFLIDQLAQAASRQQQFFSADRVADSTFAVYRALTGRR